MNFSTLTPFQAYRAAEHFLIGYFKTTGSDDIAVLLGGMQFFDWDGPADPAAWPDWEDAIALMKRNFSPETAADHLTIMQAYQTMGFYLDEYRKRICNSEEVGTCLKYMQWPDLTGAADLPAWHKWQESVIHTLTTPQKLARLYRPGEPIED